MSHPSEAYLSRCKPDPPPDSQLHLLKQQLTSLVATNANADTRREEMAGMDAKNMNFNRANNYASAANGYASQYGTRAQAGQNYGMLHNPSSDLAALAHGFQGMNLNAHSYGAQAKNGVMAGTYSLPVANTMSAAMYGHTGQYMFPSSQSPSLYTPHASQYMPQMGYQPYNQHDNSPLSQNWTPNTVANGELPTLVTPRRDSVSSNENDQPTTPSYANYPSFTRGAVAINRSPSGVFTHSTPSPTSMMGPYGVQMAKQIEQSDISPRIKMLITKEPAIPRAIPAPSSPLKPLDRALENQRGETNVYIRGLLPETTDDMLETWGSRFGDIKSSKSIIDLNTHLCKGFGFVKYHNYEDAENCIRGFHYLGYEVSFARESFYSKLKTFSDDKNTNLYVTNLPKSMNEHELAQFFNPLKVCSTRILRDKNGHARGVGFARFESRDTCEEVIKTFNNRTINVGGEDMQIQIRYADTQEQKTLKQQTQAARQFRSAEYEYATQAWRTSRLPYADSTSSGANNANEFEQYLGNGPDTPAAGRGWGRQVPGRSPLAGTPFTSSTTQSPLVQIAGSDTKGKETDSSPTAATVNSPVDSKAASEQD